MITRREPRDFRLALLLLLAVVVFLIRMTGADDLEDNSQSRNLGYVIDLLAHGHWLVQHDLLGRILSKPPLHTWLAGMSAMIFGLNRTALALPSFLAVAGMVTLVFKTARRRLGPTAAIFAGLAVVMAPLMARQTGMVRSDACFSLAIAAGAFAAFRAWETGRSWAFFWLCAGFSMMTKGPLGILLSTSGMLAWFWENRTHPPAPRPTGSHGSGLLLFGAMCLAWMLPALWFHGHELVDKMIFEELLGHIASGKDTTHSSAALRFFKPSIDFLARFAPFSLFSIAGIVRTIRRPSAITGERRFERFLVCWWCTGMLVFSLAEHQRADLILPLWPPAALLAGREMARLAARFPTRWVRATASLGGIALLAGFWFHYHPPDGGTFLSTGYSQEVRHAAEAFRATGMDPHGLLNMGVPTTFQYYLGTSQMPISPEEMLAHRAKAPLSVRVATDGQAPDPRALAGADVREIFRWPAAAAGRPPVVRVFELRWK